MDPNLALCLECDSQIDETTSLHWYKIVLLDAECFVSVGLMSLSLDDNVA